MGSQIHQRTHMGLGTTIGGSSAIFCKLRNSNTQTVITNTEVRFSLRLDVHCIVGWKTWLVSAGSCQPHSSVGVKSPTSHSEGYPPQYLSRGNGSFEHCACVLQCVSLC